jgi:hypothetical protein
MDVFIGNLPAEGKLVELDDLLGGGDVHTRFERCLGRDRFDKNYHYFVVFTDSDDEGYALIQRLDGLVFDGCRISARKYIRRADFSGSSWTGEERRINPSTSEEGS